MIERTKQTLTGGTVIYLVPETEEDVQQLLDEDDIDDDQAFSDDAEAADEWAGADIEKEMESGEGD